MTLYPSISQHVMPSDHCPSPDMRAADLPDISAVKIKELFPEIPGGHLHGEGIDFVHQKTREALENVDMQMIKPEHSVNILCSEHGFYLLEGMHYLEMLKTIKDVISERTGCRQINLQLAAGMGYRESREI